ncbi:MAG: hypothetical protein QY326_01715 [Bdellovibrionota bacterium]|nr:MAG: hypothetical protein QY326_01715 [Bdellovibrionota bacterium]
MDSANCSIEMHSGEGMERLIEEAKKALGASAAVEELVGCWVSHEGRAIVLRNALDDSQHDRCVGVGVTLLDQEKEVLSIYYTFEQLAQTFGSVRPISDFVKTATDDGAFGGVSLEVDDGGVKGVLGFDPEMLYDEELVGVLVSPTQALRMALMYASSEIGEARIELAGDEIRCTEGDEEPEWFNDPIAVMYLNYSEAIPRKSVVHGFNEVAYIRLRVQ